MKLLRLYNQNHEKKLAYDEKILNAAALWVQLQLHFMKLAISFFLYQFSN